MPAPRLKVGRTADVVVDAVKLDDEFDFVVQLALNPEKVGPGDPVSAEVGRVETNWPPWITVGIGPTEVTNSAALWNAPNVPGPSIPFPVHGGLITPTMPAWQ